MKVSDFLKSWWRQNLKVSGFLKSWKCQNLKMSDFFFNSESVRIFKILKVSEFLKSWRKQLIEFSDILTWSGYTCLLRRSKEWQQKTTTPFWEFHRLDTDPTHPSLKLAGLFDQEAIDGSFWCFKMIWIHLWIIGF